MTSEQKIKTNRANARRSTGPKTARGKSRAAQNARRHGLSLPITADPFLRRQIEELARKIAGAGSSAESLQFAFQIAEAQLDIIRIRQVRYDHWARHLSNPEYKPRVPDSVIIKGVMISLTEARFEGANKKIPARVVKARNCHLEELENLLMNKPEGNSKLSHILLDVTSEIVVLDRYERRALSRRKFAIRALDAVRSEART